MAYRKRISGNINNQFVSDINQIKVNTSDLSNANFSSFLPFVYYGQPQRRQRYNQYDIMDLDPEINASLDTIAEFCTQINNSNNTPFKIIFHDTPTESETKALVESLKDWVRLNNFNKRIFAIFRNTIKYGDQFFIRDPSTKKWLWVDQTKVISVTVDQSKGKKPVYYVIEGLEPNLQSLVATVPPPAFQQSLAVLPKIPGPVTTSLPRYDVSLGNQYQYGASRFTPVFVKAEHMIHISLSDGMDNNWPFGVSILEPIFKTFKQKELLEDAIIIYRVQRAPERRVFYIDVGDMTPDKARQYIERIKNEIHQRRIPNIAGGGTSLMDATYNPLSILEDYFIPQYADGRGNKVETLPGGENLGQIDDLIYFDRKLKRGLRIPPAYLPGSNEEPSLFNDGRVGSAFIQEFRFNKFCQRLQDSIVGEFDKDFKRFLRERNIYIDSNIFEITFNDPQSFSKYRQIELDSNLVNTYTSLADRKHFSKRFLMKRYLGLTDEEIAMNEEMLIEEMSTEEDEKTSYTDVNLENIGMSEESEENDLNMEQTPSKDENKNETDMNEGATYEK